MTSVRRAYSPEERGITQCSIDENQSLWQLALSLHHPTPRSARYELLIGLTLIQHQSEVFDEHTAERSRCRDKAGVKDEGSGTDRQTEREKEPRSRKMASRRIALRKKVKSFVALWKPVMNMQGTRGFGYGTNEISSAAIYQGRKDGHPVPLLILQFPQRCRVNVIFERRPRREGWEAKAREPGVPSPV